MSKDYIKKGISNLAKKNVNKKLAENRAAKKQMNGKELKEFIADSWAKNKYLHKK